MANKKFIPVLVALFVALVFVSGCIGQQEAKPKTQSETSAGEIKEFEITAKQFEFTPSTITVNKGDTVKLKINSIDVTHGFTIDEFGVNAQILLGETTTVEFVADKAGTFTFYCSVYCGPGHSEMNGKLIVE